MSINWDNPDLLEPVMVTINEKEYPTQLYDGVQRFVPDRDVATMVSLGAEYMSLIGRPARSYYHLISDSLKKLDHANPVVNHYVEMNQYGFYGLNELAIDKHEEKFTIDEWIEFETLHGWSVGGFCDSIISRLYSMGYTDEVDSDEPHIDTVFTLRNPFWKD